MRPDRESSRRPHHRCPADRRQALRMRSASAPSVRSRRRPVHIRASPSSTSSSPRSGAPTSTATRRGVDGTFVNLSIPQKPLPSRRLRVARQSPIDRRHTQRRLPRRRDDRFRAAHASARKSSDRPTASMTRMSVCSRAMSAIASSSTQTMAKAAKSDPESTACSLMQRKRRIPSSKGGTSTRAAIGALNGLPSGLTRIFTGARTA